MQNENLRSLPEPEDDGDVKTLSDIASHGWHVIKVPELDSTPGWAFSLGLFHNYGHPEIVVFGLSLDRMHEIVNVIGEMVAEGHRFLPGATSHDVVDGYQCEFREVKRVWYKPFLGYAMWLYRGSEFPVCQCLWPDRNGNSRLSPAFDDKTRALQPVLEFESEEAAGVAALLASMKSGA